MQERVGFITRAIRTRLWHYQNGYDAFIIAQGYRIPVHTWIVAAESPYLSRQFERGANINNMRTYFIYSTDVHTVFRALSLIYLGTYSDLPYPHVQQPETSDDLLKHSLVYRLCKHWEISMELLDISFQQYQSVAADTTGHKRLFDSIQPFQKPIIDTVAPRDVLVPKILLNGFISEDEFEEDRLVTFAISKACNLMQQI